MNNTTLVKKLNAGSYAAAADHFLVWNKITDPDTHAKIVCDTLVKRRKRERDLFLKPQENDTQEGQ